MTLLPVDAFSLSINFMFFVNKLRGGKKLLEIKIAETVSKKRRTRWKDLLHQIFNTYKATVIKYMWYQYKDRQMDQ